MGKNAYLFIVADVVVAYSSGIDVLIFSLIERTVRYHVLLFPAVSQSDSVIHTHTPLLPQILCPYRLSLTVG